MGQHTHMSSGGGGALGPVWGRVNKTGVALLSYSSECVCVCVGGGCSRSLAFFAFFSFFLPFGLKRALTHTHMDNLR